MSEDQFPSDPRSSGGTLERLSQVAVKGAECDSRERQPHPKCLQGTRVALLGYINRILDNREKSRLIWLHGTAGVGKSAVAFTVAERMRGLRVREQVTNEKRLAGSFFFSRKHTKRCTTGYVFATLVYQLVSNFPSIREDINKVIRDNPALLDADKSLRDQMEALFLQPLRQLRFRLRECPPLVFVIDALDECTSETELADLISLLGRALREPDLPVTHILLTSRSEAHIREAIEEDEVRPLVWEIPVKTSGEGVSTIISLDGIDVDNDIYIFLEHSFAKLQRRCSNFPQPSREELTRLASRAGRRFIVASTMMKFIDDEYYDPRSRLQLMLGLTSEPLPGTEVYKLYDRIIATCTNPTRAYLHLSVVASLADPLPISEISKLLGPGEGRDVEEALVQLRSIMDIPSDNSFPVNIYHSTVRDYASNPSNCSLPQAHITLPHSLLAYSSLCLMMQDIPESTALLDAFSNLKRQSKFMLPHDPQTLKYSLSFIVQPPEPLQVLIGLLWLRGDRSSDLQFWLETLDGRGWLKTQSGRDWLQFSGGREWLYTQSRQEWLQVSRQVVWLKGEEEQVEEEEEDRLQTMAGGDWGQDWVQTLTRSYWLSTQSGQDWLLTPAGQHWLFTYSGRYWLQTQSGMTWLQTPGGRDWLQTPAVQNWLKTSGGRNWLHTQSGRDWMQTPRGQAWQLCPTAPVSVWVTMEEFSSMVEMISEYMILPEWSSKLALQVIQQFKSMPDFLIFPVFLALRNQGQSTPASPQGCFTPDMEIIHVMKSFVCFANEARERSQSASDALKYACQNWAFHLSRALNQWDDKLKCLFNFFWNHHLLSWLERQWCLKDLRSCLTVLSEGEKLAKEHVFQAP